MSMFVLSACTPETAETTPEPAVMEETVPANDAMVDDTAPADEEMIRDLTNEGEPEGGGTDDAMMEDEY